MKHARIGPRAVERNATVVGRAGVVDDTTGGENHNTGREGIAAVPVLAYIGEMLILTRIFLFGFGVAAIGGGVMGFVRAQSKASLIAGGGAGVLLLLAGYLAGTASARIGLGLGLALSILLAGRFVPAYLKTKKPMPAGLMAVLAIAGAILTGVALVTG